MPMENHHIGGTFQRLLASTGLAYITASTVFRRSTVHAKWRWLM